MHIAHRRIFCSATLWAAGLGTSFATEPTATPIPLHAFAELPAIEQPQLSPDGRGAVMVQTIDGKGYVVVSGFGEKPRIVLKSDGDKYTIGMVRWAGNRRVLVGARFQEDRRGVRTFESRLIAVDRDGGNLKGDLTLGIQQGNAFERARRVPQFQDRIVGALPDEPETVLIALDASAPGQPDVYRLDTRTGRSRLVQRNLGGIRQWMADAQGEVRLGYGVTRTVLRVMVRPPAAPAENKSENKDEIGSGSGSWRPLMSYEGTDPAEARRLALKPLGFDADPRFLYALAPVDGRDALVRIDLQDPAFPRETLLADARFDVRGELLREPRTRRVVGFDYRTDVSRVVYWNDAARQRQEALDRALPQRGNRIVSDDDAGQQSIVLSVAGSRPPQYFTMSWTNRQLVRLADTHPSLEGLPLSTPKRIALTSRDGLALEGYLTLPPAREANANDHVKAVPLPTVLLPHGGPASADTGRYDYWAQFLASRGWAVLQLNFRGSIGYGQDFREAGRKRWGLEMQDDLADGLRWLVDQGIADARRVCIVGGSYGGYAALMGAVKDPALYRCVVSFAGPSDLRDLLSFSQRFMDYELGAEAQIGTWWGDRDKLRQTSPALRAGEIKVPVLLIHGAQDAVVPVEQSRDMAEALKKAGHSDTRYVELPLGDHTLSREEDRVRVMTELETFLKKNLDENTDAQATRGMYPLRGNRHHRTWFYVLNTLVAIRMNGPPETYNMLSSLLQFPPRESAYRRKFLSNTDENLFMGSFDSFAAAEAGAPPSKAVGYANADAGELYSPQIYFYDYPGLFWLGRSIDAGMTRIFDLGGHVGIKYYAFRRVLTYPDTLRWTVCDVPGVVEAGRAMAVKREATGQLDFTTDYRDATGCDVLYASGSLQYLPTRMDAILSSLPVKPRRIVMNTTAVHPERTIFTLNSIGVAVCPYRIQHHDELLADLARSGYKKRDVWRNEGKPIEVPFVDGGDKPYYAGCCFDLAS